MRIGSHFFAYLSRMRFIQRWALMRNTAPENVQEHSHQVAVLAHALAVIRNEKFGGHADAGAHREHPGLGRLFGGQVPGEKYGRHARASFRRKPM